MPCSQKAVSFLSLCLPDSLFICLSDSYCMSLCVSFFVSHHVSDVSLCLMYLRVSLFLCLSVSLMSLYVSLPLCLSMCLLFSVSLSICLSLPPWNAFVSMQLRIGEASEGVILFILILQVTLLLVDICVTPEIQKELLNRWEPDLCKWKFYF